MFAIRMSYRVFIIGVIFVFLLGLAVPMQTARAATPRYVDKASPGDSGDCSSTPCLTINYAVGQSASGDTIDVGAGTYVENVTIAKSVSVIGNSGGTTILSGSSGNGFVVSSGTVTIQYFTIKGFANGINVSGGTVYANSNSIIDNTTTGVTQTGGTVNAENNWWGSACPDFSVIISGSVDYDPWLVIAGTTLSSDGVKTIFTDVSSSLSGQGVDSNIGTVTACGTTSWTSFSGLYFEKRTNIADPTTAVGKITFSSAMDLSADETTTFLKALGTKMEQANGRIAFDARTSAEFAAHGAALVMYNLPPGLTLAELVVRDDNGTILDSSTVVSGFSQDPVTHNVTFNTAHFTQFDIDTTSPSVASFTVTTPSKSLNIPITAFTASDNIGVTGYKVTTSSTPPAAGDPGWAVTAPTTYTVASDGSYTLYPWAKDATGNVSAVFGSPRAVVVDKTAPIVVSSLRADPNPSTASSVHFNVSFSEAVTGVDKTDFSLTVSGISGASVSTVSGSGATRTVTVNSGSGHGTLRLNVVDNDSILDGAGNPLGGTGAGNGNYTSGQKYTIDRDNQFYSSAAQDGWVLESAKGSGVGGTKDATATTFMLGDDKLNRQYRGILSFNTASLPDNATILSAVLKIKQSGAAVGSNPFSVLGSLYADIRKGYFGSSLALQVADFNAAVSAGKVVLFGKTPVSGWYSATVNLSGLNNINKTGLTQFRLYFSKATNTNNKADLMNFVSGNASSGQPQLIITYTLP